MLDIVRENKRGIVTWFIVGGIVIVFAINFGPGSLSKGGGCGGPQKAASYAAKVNGETIPVFEWQRAYEEIYRMGQQQARLQGVELTPELASLQGLPQVALDQVVDRELVVQEARRRGIVVTDEEISSEVQGMGAFQQNGAFSFEAYSEATGRAYGSPAKFEAALRNDLLFRKMMAAVRQTVKVSDAEVREAWEAGADRAELTFVRFPISAARAEAKPTDAEVKAFAGKEGARIEKFYADSSSRYDQPKKVRARHVLARVAPDAAKDQDEAARKKIEAAAARVKKGEDFAAVAQAVSDDEPSKARGGEIGYVTEGLMEEAFAKAALALEPGQVSEPVRSSAGWHIVKADEIVPAKKTSLDQARLEIARELLVDDVAKKLATERAQAALAAARTGKSLTELFPGGEAAPGKRPTVGGQPVKAEDTGAFTAGSPFLPKLGNAPELLAAALAAKAGDVLPKVYDTAAGPVVAVVKTRERPDPAAFAAQKDAFQSRLVSQKELQIDRAWLDALKKDASVEVNPQLASAQAPRRR